MRQFVTPAIPLGHVLAARRGWGLSMGQLLSLPMLVAGMAWSCCSVRARRGMRPLEAADPRREIASAGPMRVDEYMALCLGHPEHGYYMTRDPLGAAGDFITAPEISQMFGELLGAWTAQVWARLRARRRPSCSPNSGPAAER